MVQEKSLSFPETRNNASCSNALVYSALFAQFYINLQVNVSLLRSVFLLSSLLLVLSILGFSLASCIRLFPRCVSSLFIPFISYYCNSLFCPHFPSLIPVSLPHLFPACCLPSLLIPSVCLLYFYPLHISLRFVYYFSSSQAPSNKSPLCISGFFSSCLASFPQFSILCTLYFHISQFI